MQSRDNPLQILCAIAGVISVMVVVTVFISTVTFLRNKKSNRILPSRRVRRRTPARQHHRQSWVIFQNPFQKRRRSPASKDQEEEEGGAQNAEPAENVNCNNNVVDVGQCRHHHSPYHHHHHQPPPPPPPHAPALPPPPLGADRGRPVPSVSALVAANKPKRKGLFRDREDSLNVALVSELKKRLEQKRMENRY